LKRAVSRPGSSEPEAALPFERSIGYQVRLTHNLLQRYLQLKIAPYGLTLGMWYFLRALWHQDGLTQRELSVIVGTMEPTTLIAIKAMEKIGLVRRRRNADDKRKINIFLTARGQSLKAEVLPLARHVVDAATEGFSAREVEKLLDLLGAAQGNLKKRIAAQSKS
jgi:DNA-binding MarR family transcriptional regulator